MEEDFQKKVERLENQENQIMGYICIALFAVIFISVWGIIKVVFLAGISFLAYILARKVFDYFIHRLISNFELVLWVIVGFIVFDGLTEMIISINI